MTATKLMAILLAWALLLLGTPDAAAASEPQCGDEIGLLLSPGFNETGRTSILFGYAMAAHGDILVVGTGDNSTDYLGRAFVYQVDTTTGDTTQLATLSAFDETGANYFGRATAMSQNLIAVGAPGRNSLVGGVYLFPYSGATVMTNDSTLVVADDGQAQDSFGRVIVFSENLMMVSATGVNGNRGAVYVFTVDSSGTNVTQTLKFTAANLTSGSFFGRALAISGRRLAVGMVEKVSIYELSPSGDSATELQEVTVMETGEGFGVAVALLGTILIVGASAFNSCNEGAVYVFIEDDQTGLFVQQQLIEGNVENAQLGTTISLYGQTAIFGAPFGSTPYALHYSLNATANPTASLTQFINNTAQSNRFGYSSVVQSDFFAVGGLFDPGQSHVRIFKGCDPEAETVVSSTSTSTSTSSSTSTSTSSSTSSSTTSSATPAFCVDFDNADFQGTSGFTPFAGQPVTQGGWSTSNGTLTYLPSTNGRFYGYFPSVTTQDRFALLVANNTTFQAGYEYQVTFKALRTTTVHPSVLYVQLRGKATGKAVAGKAITTRTFDSANINGSNTLQAVASGVVDSSMDADQVAVLVSSIGTGGASFGITDIEVCAFPLMLA